MADKLEPDEIVSLQENVMGNTYIIEAIVRLLDKKGLVDKAEVLEELKKLQSK
jgi:hypothetical protein